MFTGIIIKPISNIIVGDVKIVFVVILEPNGMLIHLHFISINPEHFEVVSDMIQELFNLEQIIIINGNE